MVAMRSTIIETGEAYLPTQFDVIIERDEEGYYVASVPQIPGSHTQARSLDEVTLRIREAGELCPQSRGRRVRASNSSVSCASRLRQEPETGATTSSPTRTDEGR
jgi:predicted RNase H-like HicB family nuclease